LIGQTVFHFFPHDVTLVRYVLIFYAVIMRLSVYMSMCHKQALY